LFLFVNFFFLNGKVGRKVWDDNLSQVIFKNKFAFFDDGIRVFMPVCPVCDVRGFNPRTNRRFAKQTPEPAKDQRSEHRQALAQAGKFLNPKSEIYPKPNYSHKIYHNLFCTVN
jgi:hypothetical protein